MFAPQSGTKKDGVIRQGHQQKKLCSLNKIWRLRIAVKSKSTSFEEIQLLLFLTRFGKKGFIPHTFKKYVEAIPCFLH